MSGYKTHTKVGAIVGTIPTFAFSLLLSNEQLPHYKYFDTIPLWVVLFCIPISTLYSLLPDIDTKSMGSKIFYCIIIIGLCFLYGYELYQIGCIVAIFSLLPQLIKHRGITHTLWFAIVFPLPIWLIFNYFHLQIGYFVIFYMSAFWGYMSHLTTDLIRSK